MNQPKDGERNRTANDGADEGPHQFVEPEGKTDLIRKWKVGKLGSADFLMMAPGASVLRRCGTLGKGIKSLKDCCCHEGVLSKCR